VLGGSAGAVELPPIELPEYIIAGVEQATRITGARIPVGVSARIGVPAESPVSRPKLLTASVWTPPQQPALLLPLGEGSWRSYLGGGGFGKGEAGIELARARSSVSYGAAMGVLKPPNRSGAGAGLDRGIRGLIYGRVGRAGVLAPEIGFGRSSFTLNQAMGGGKRDWTDAYLGFGFSPLSTGAGLLTAGSCLDRWSLSGTGKIVAMRYQLDARHSLPLGSGCLESSVDAVAEPTEQGDDKLGLLQVVTMYRLRHHSINYLAGFRLYTGAAAVGTPRRGATPVLGLEWRLAGESTVSLVGDPEPNLLSLRSLFRSAPMISDSSRGSILEETGHLRMGFTTLLSRRIRINLNLSHRSVRHYPFAVPTSVGDWEIEYRRLNLTGAEVQVDYAFDGGAGIGLNANVRKAETKPPDGLAITSLGDRAPQFSFASSALEGSVPAGRWMLASELQWESRAPVDFAGDWERPSRVVWNASVNRRLGSGWEFILGMNNILNSSYYDYPGFDQPPFTVSLKLEYHGGWSSPPWKPIRTSREAK